MAMTEEKAERIAQEYAKINYKGKIAPLIAVGYSPNYAKALGLKLYDNVVVKAAIERIKAVVSEETGINTKWVIDKLVEVAERCTKPPYDNPGANKAIELLGKHVGVFEADNAQKGDKTINIVNFNNIDDTKQIISGPVRPARVTGSKSV